MVDRSKERDKSSLGYFNESSRREIAGKNGSGQELGGARARARVRTRTARAGRKMRRGEFRGVGWEGVGGFATNPLLIGSRVSIPEFASVR